VLTRSLQTDMLSCWQNWLTGRPQRVPGVTASETVHTRDDQHGKLVAVGVVDACFSVAR
jgi:hypothetical protein